IKYPTSDSNYLFEYNGARLNTNITPDAETGRNIRASNHLARMYEDDYYNKVVISGIDMYGYNPVKYIKWTNNYNWKIAPTTCPTFKDHIFMTTDVVSSDVYKTPNILADMYKMYVDTGYAIFNNMVLGSIWEV